MESQTSEGSCSHMPDLRERARLRREKARRSTPWRTAAKGRGGDADMPLARRVASCPGLSMWAGAGCEALLHSGGGGGMKTNERELLEGVHGAFGRLTPTLKSPPPFVVTPGPQGGGHHKVVTPPPPRGITPKTFFFVQAQQVQRV